MNLSKFWIVNCVLFATAKCATVTPISSWLNNYMYGYLIVLLVIGIIKSKSLKVDRCLLLYILTSAVGLLILSPPFYFKSWERLLAFCLSLAFFSPLLQSAFFAKYRWITAKVVIVCLHIIVALSFVCYFLGISLASYSEFNGYDWSFSGITTQAMILAPCSAVVFMFSVWALLYNRPSKKCYVLLHIVFVSLSLWLMLVAGSRGSLMGTIVALTPIILAYKQFGKLVTRLLIIVSLISIAAPSSLYDKAFYTINRKQERANILNSATSSRDEKWDARWEEFEDSPIVGVGIYTQTHYTSDDDIDWIMKTGGLEPGTSWLAILAMTGLIGFSIMATFLKTLFKNLYANYKKEKVYALLFSLFVFFCLHGVFEGWIIYSGGIVFFLFWLLCGVCDALLKHGSEIRTISAKTL